jgi:hypothetical protein
MPEQKPVPPANDDAESEGAHARARFVVEDEPVNFFSIEEAGRSPFARRLVRVFRWRSRTTRSSSKSLTRESAGE